MTATFIDEDADTAFAHTLLVLKRLIATSTPRNLAHILRIAQRLLMFWYVLQHVFALFKHLLLDHVLV